LNLKCSDSCAALGFVHGLLELIRHALGFGATAVYVARQAVGPLLRRGCPLSHLAGPLLRRVGPLSFLGDLLQKGLCSRRLQLQGFVDSIARLLLRTEC